MSIFDNIGNSGYKIEDLRPDEHNLSADIYAMNIVDSGKSISARDILDWCFYHIDRMAEIKKTGEVDSIAGEAYITAKKILSDCFMTPGKSMPHLERNFFIINSIRENVYYLLRDKLALMRNITFSSDSEEAFYKSNIINSNESYLAAMIMNWGYYQMANNTGVFIPGTIRMPAPAASDGPDVYYYLCCFSEQAGAGNDLHYVRDLVRSPREGVDLHAPLWDSGKSYTGKQIIEWLIHNMANGEDTLKTSSEWIIANLFIHTKTKTRPLPGIYYYIHERKGQGISGIKTFYLSRDEVKCPRRQIQNNEETE